MKRKQCWQVDKMGAGATRHSSGTWGRFTSSEIEDVPHHNTSTQHYTRNADNNGTVLSKQQHSGIQYVRNANSASCALPTAGKFRYLEFICQNKRC